ncbi:MAG TPA: VOC family protein [Rhodanobacteraceae bacterium]
MKTNRSIPNAAIIPELAYEDVATAARWLADAFGFRERLRIANHRIQLTFAGSAIVVKDGTAQPTTAESARHSILLRVDDLDSMFERAVRGGARVIREPADHPFGERQCTIQDPGGHVWTLSQSIADVNPADWGGELVGD